MSTTKQKTTWVRATVHREMKESWWIGKTVRLTRALQTCDGSAYAKGRIAKVTRKFGGLHLRGARLWIRRVDYESLEVRIEK